MKKYAPIIGALALISVALTLGACQTSGPGTATAAPPNSGHVLIYRVANFGEDMALVVSIDGKEVGSFTEGANYSGYLPAGQHRLTVRAEPNRAGTRPGRKTVTIQTGQTYVYTAAWSGGNLVLVRGH